MKANEDDVVELPNGCAAVECPLPESWWLGMELVLCGCGEPVVRVYPFAKIGTDRKRRLWVRLRHRGFGFCEVEAVSEERRRR